MQQKGFIPVIYLIGILLAGLLTVLITKTLTDPNFIINTLIKKSENSEPTITSSSPSGEFSPTPTTSTTNIPPSTTLTPTLTKKPTAIKTPTPTPKPTATSTTSSCNYNLNSPTGAVKIAVQTQTGSLTTSFYGELKASTGCKVLDGRSTDTQKTYGSLNTKEIIFSSVPPGNYNVRAYVAGSWTNSQNVNVSAGQLATVSYSVTGDPAATPTPKPVCTTPVAMPSSGSAPLTVNLYIGYTGGGSSSNLTNIQWDLTGDGSWDVTISYGNPYQYTYQNPGTYTVKGRIQNSSGIYSDPCQTTITVN